MTPTPEEVLESLENILKSDSFAQSQRHKSFLRFIVEETLAGRGDRIKGFTIAIEVFGKPSDFDVQNDPYVRVEAGRLRKRLAEYYRSEGGNDQVRIALNPGSYTPRFSHVEAESPTARIPYREASRLWSPLVAAVLLIASATVVAWWLYRENINAQRALGEPPTIGVYVFDDNGESDFSYFANGLHADLFEKLDRYGTVWGMLNVYPLESGEEPAPDIEFDYFLQGTVARFDDSVNVTARLTDGPTGEQVWSDSFDGRFFLTGVVDLQERFSTEIANYLREPFGALADAEVQKVTVLPPDSLSAYQCNVLFLAAVDKLDRQSRDTARTCLERHDRSDALDATGLGALAVLYHLEYDDGIDLLSGEDSAADAAYDAAERAVSRDSNDIVAQMAMAFVQLARGDLSQANTAFERLMSGNPPTASLGVAALLMTKLGDGDQGLSWYQNATRQTSRSTPSLYFGPVVHYLEQGDYSQALGFANRIDAPEFTMFQIIRAALEAHVGDTVRANRLIEAVYRKHANFSDYGRELIGRWALPPLAEQRLIEGLEKAGVELR